MVSPPPPPGVLLTFLLVTCIVVLCVLSISPPPPPPVRYYPLVSALTMIAPSPDWFVGVDSLNLCDGASWKSKVTVPMYAWDAGKRAVCLAM